MSSTSCCSSQSATSRAECPVTATFKPTARSRSERGRRRSIIPSRATTSKDARFPWIWRRFAARTSSKAHFRPVPLSGDISTDGAFGYSRMRELGPNDGLTMLVDQLLPGGLTIVEPGVDHYFGHPGRELRSLALLEVLWRRIGAIDA